MKFIARYAAAFLVTLIAALAAAPVSSAETVRDGVFIHISRGPEDPHRVLMGLNMAKMMSQDHDVLVYFDIDGVQVVLADSPDLTFGAFPSSKTQIAALLDSGVTLMACPGCLEAAGKSAADLAPGVQLADRNGFFSFTAGRILTLDY
ncbi:DsrE family protein [Mycolicibacterium palauense]|uniref:DsrE family protein n=1 Tax=Mycolicibacterium palauense TaxID=2034511 RepID=UPI001C3F40D0|nr:DsrE family protein [Mycolicibacterium palauense]